MLDNPSQTQADLYSYIAASVHNQLLWTFTPSAYPIHGAMTLARMTIPGGLGMRFRRQYYPNLTPKHKPFSRLATILNSTINHQLQCNLLTLCSDSPCQYLRCPNHLCRSPATSNILTKPCLCTQRRPLPRCVKYTSNHDTGAYSHIAAAQTIPSLHQLGKTEWHCESPACKSPACKSPACKSPACKSPACKSPACKSPACKYLILHSLIIPVNGRLHPCS